MCYDCPLGQEESPTGGCPFCDLTFLQDFDVFSDWDHFDYHLLTRHFDQMVQEFGDGSPEYPRLLQAKKQRLQRELGM